MRSILTTLCFLISLQLSAQTNRPKIGCKDANLLVQASELKESLLKQGFEVINDAMLSMDSREDFPIVTRMQAGAFYQIVMIGNTRSKRMNLSLYGPDQQPLIQKEQQPLHQTSNVISFSFSPSLNGDHTFMLSQTMKQELLKFKGKETICGSFCILRLKKASK
ncbi:MAG: hypothetical protein IT256_02280 [Chitinophagaceae bacterium]|nr:hypothetical protein [Chitinophagaceae bacterium]